MDTEINSAFHCRTFLPSVAYAYVQSRKPAAVAQLRTVGLVVGQHTALLDIRIPRPPCFRSSYIECQSLRVVLYERKQHQSKILCTLL